MSNREVLVYEILGKFLDGCYVLDVGSGACRTIDALFKYAQIPWYMSIDYKVPPVIHKNVKGGYYMPLDILTEDIGHHDKSYDVVIMDIEPHGKEVEVYEKIKHLMKENHLCILKHVGKMDLYGAQLADKFIHNYIDRIADFYGECNFLDSTVEIRDIFILFGNDKTDNIRSLNTVGDPSPYIDASFQSYIKRTW
jgi:hypothetical protein